MSADTDSEMRKETIGGADVLRKAKRRKQGSYGEKGEVKGTRWVGIRKIREKGKGDNQQNQILFENNAMKPNTVYESKKI